MVDLTKYEMLDRGDADFLDLCKTGLSRDHLHYPVFLPNGRVDLLIIKTRSGKYRVAKDTTKKYVNNIADWTYSTIDSMFDVFKLKGKENVYLLKHQYMNLQIMVDIEPLSIKKKYIYSDGTTKTKTFRR
jgi:hypothetical protein